MASRAAYRGLLLTVTYTLCQQHSGIALAALRAGIGRGGRARLVESSEVSI